MPGQDNLDDEYTKRLQELWAHIKGQYGNDPATAGVSPNPADNPNRIQPGQMAQVSFDPNTGAPSALSEWLRLARMLPQVIGVNVAPQPAALPQIGPRPIGPLGGISGGIDAQVNPTRWKIPIPGGGY